MLRFIAPLAAALFLWVSGPATAYQEPAYIVVDAGSGAVLLHENADQPWYPASVTKLMTAYVTFQAIRAGWQEAPGRQLIELPHAINDPEFAAALVDSFHQIVR